MFTSRYRELLRAGVRDPFACPEGGKSAAAPAPDYRGAAEEQAASSREVTTAQTWANRPTLNTPWGQQTWNANASVDPSTGQPITQWTSDINLTPEQQAALDSQQAIQQGRSELGQGFMGRVSDAYEQPFDYSNAPKAPGSIEEAQQGSFAQMSKMFEPGRAQQRESLEAKMLAQGVDPSSEAYKRQQAGLGEQFARQDMQTAIEAQNQGRTQAQAQQQLRQQYIAEEMQRRGMSLNELNAVLTGQQVSMPQMPGFQNAQRSEATGYANAASQQGQWDLTQQQNKAASAPDIGSMIGTGASMAMMFSDRRLKTDVIRVGTHPCGVGVYAYSIFGVPAVGVMAQELMRVRPDLVHRHASGYLMVDYGGL